ncbi:MAG: F0F1 ATP synthase subunit delta [Treponema sp.]|nr:F0F1 ATP synthase subunit delta [Treponema sp.]
MFHRDRWTEAFFAVSGENADAFFLCLKALVPAVQAAHGALFGYGASAALEKTMRESAGANVSDPAVERAIRFICLLVEKNCFKYADSLLEAVGQELDKRKGILDISVESAAIISSGLQEELTRAIKEKTHAAEIRMKTIIKPELLGGFLLRIGGFYIDASLKGQLDALTAELAGR